MTSMAHLKTVAFRASDFRVPPFVIKKERGVTEISQEYTLSGNMIRLNIAGHDRHTLLFSLRKGADGRMLMQFSLYNYDYHLIAREYRAFADVLKALKAGEEVFSGMMSSILSNWIDANQKDVQSLIEVIHEGILRAIEQVHQNETPKTKVVKPALAAKHRFYHNHRVQAA